MNGDHDEEVQHGDNDAGQLERLGGEERTNIDEDSVDFEEVGAREELEAQEEGGERVGDDQGEDEGDVRPRDLVEEKSTFMTCFFIYYFVQDEKKSF